MSTTKLPNFSFILDKQLAGCGMLGYRRHLKSHGVTAIVSLTEFPLSASFSTGEDPTIPEKKKKLIESNFKYLHLPIQDQGIPSMKQFVEYCEFVTNTIENGGAVVTHCFAGRGRTGTMLAGFLVQTGMSAADAIQLVRQKRPHSIETRGQEESIALLETYLKNRQQNNND